MLGHSHAVVGFATLATAQAVSLRVRAVTELAQPIVQPHPVHIPNFGEMPLGWLMCASAAILGALLPDLDAEDSTILREVGSCG